MKLSLKHLLIVIVVFLLLFVIWWYTFFKDTGDIFVLPPKEVIITTISSDYFDKTSEVPQGVISPTRPAYFHTGETITASELHDAVNVGSSPIYFCYQESEIACNGTVFPSEHFEVSKEKLTAKKTITAILVVRLVNGTYWIGIHEILGTSG
jgi:cytoskeletal protein RodZ